MQVKIRNNKTGETRMVDSTQLGQYGIKSPGQASAPQGPVDQPPSNQTVDQLAGAAGSTAGNFLGALIPGLDLTGISEEGLGAGGGALAQGGAAAIQDLFSGKGLDMKDIASNTAQGGIYGAIPMGGESRLITAGGKFAGKGLMKTLGRTATRAAYGAIGNMGAKTVQNWGEGNNPDQGLENTGGVGAIVNALVGPGLVRGGKAVQDLLGLSPEKLTSAVARHLVGDEASRNPAIRDNLVLTPVKDHAGNTIPQWQASRDNLTRVAVQKYQLLQKALKQTSGNLGDFFSTIKEGMDKSGASDEVVARNMKNMMVTAFRQLGIDTEKVDPEIYKLGEEAVNRLNRYQGRGDILNNVKTDHLSSIYKDFPAAYSAGKKAIEDIVGSKANTKQINKDYHDLTEAAQSIHNKFSGMTGKDSMGAPMGWMQRMAMTYGAGNIASLFGLGPTSAATVGLPSLAYIGTALKDAATDTPEKSTGVARTLGVANPTVAKLLQQLMLHTGASAGKQPMQTQPNFTGPGVNQQLQ